MICIMTLLFSIMTPLYHCFFLQMSRLLLFIISLSPKLSPKGLLFHLWHFSYYITYCFLHRLLLLLPLSHYYVHYYYHKLIYYYLFQSQYYYSAFFSCINISITAIITLLFVFSYLKLWLLVYFSKIIIPIICFRVYYCDYVDYHANMCIIFLSNYYHNNPFQILLYRFFSPEHYLHYCKLWQYNTAIIRKSDTTAIILIWSHLRTKVEYGYRYWV